MLEAPDFLSQLAYPLWTLPRLLRRPNLPVSFLHALCAHDNPWIALEAQTHIGLASEEEPPPIPLDMKSLDALVLDYLSRDEPRFLAVYRELVSIGLLPAQDDTLIPRDEQMFRAQQTAPPSERVLQVVAEARKWTGQRSSRREAWLAKQIDMQGSNVLGPHPDTPGERLFWARVLCQPDIPQWVGRAFFTWQQRSRGIIWGASLEESVLRRSIMLHTPDQKGYQSRAAERRLQELLLSPLFSFHTDNQALPYLILRAHKPSVAPPYEGIRWNGYVSQQCPVSFLARLSVALNLDAFNALKHTPFAPPPNLREWLINDGNRYVRAAARGQLKAPAI